MILGFDRRLFLGTALASLLPMSAQAAAVEGGRYGLVGRMKALPGKRTELAAALLEGTAGMPGCLSYIVAEDAADADTLWVTEVWIDAASHKASLQLPAVRAAITKGRPLIAAFDTLGETRPLGGTGLSG